MKAGPWCAFVSGDDMVRIGRPPLTPEQHRARLVQRFWKKVKKSSKCWEWTGSKNRGGYGQIMFRPQELRRAHRVAWELSYGPAPKGLWVLHRCDNRSCVRPKHLFVGDRVDNMQDASRKGRARGRFSYATHCIHGHALEGRNLYRTPAGRRQCRACGKIRCRAAHRRRVAASLLKNM